MKPALVIIASNSIHSLRFIRGIAATDNYKLSLISNSYLPEFSNYPQMVVDFSLRNVAAYKKIVKHLQQENPAIVHIHQANSYAWHSLRAINHLTSRPKIVLTTWGSDVLVLPKHNWLMRRMVIANLRQADVITADSLFMAAQIAALLQPDSRAIQVINFGLNQLPAKAEAQTKTKLILSNRLHKPLYQIDKIIYAFASLVATKQIDDSYRLVVVANGTETAKLKQLTSTLAVEDRIEFTGMLNFAQLSEYYAQAQIFVSIPSSDSTASSLLEAMAYGLIPVLANLPANTEWVLDQINGFIVPQVDELAQQLLAAVALTKQPSRYQALIDFNYQLIQQKALRANSLTQFEAIYDLLLGAPNVS
jgi:glycosyltransferase involved in cell wall biosynthesis